MTCQNVGPALGDLHTEVHKPLIAWLAWHACKPQHAACQPQAMGRQLHARCAKSTQERCSYMPPSCLEMDEAKNEMNL